MALQDDVKVGFDRAFRMLRFDRAAMNEVADDEKGMTTGIILLAIAGGVAGIGSLLFSPIAALLGPVVHVVAGFLCALLVFLVGLLFRPPVWDLTRLFRVVSHIGVLGAIGVVGIIPFLGQAVVVIASVYAAVVLVVAIETTAKADRNKAILIVVLPSLACCAIAAVAGMMGMLALAGLGGMGH